MAIKINLMPRKESEAAEGGGHSWPNYLTLSLDLFVICLIIFSGIYYYDTFVLQKKLDSLEKQNTEIQDNISRAGTAEELSRMVDAVSKGKNIQTILGAHLYGSKIYELLEKITIKGVTYGKFSEKINSDKTISVSLSGQVDSYRTLTKQLMVMKKTKEIKNITFNEALIDKDGQVSFKVDLAFSANFITLALK